MTYRTILAAFIVSLSAALSACGEDDACDKLEEQCGQWMGAICGRDDGDPDVEAGQCILDEAADPCLPDFEEYSACGIGPDPNDPGV